LFFAVPAGNNRDIAAVPQIKSPEPARLFRSAISGESFPSSDRINSQEMYGMLQGSDLASLIPPEYRPTEMDRSDKLLADVTDNPDSTVYNPGDPLDKQPQLVWMKYPSIMTRKDSLYARCEIILKVLVDQKGRPETMVVLSEKPANSGIGEAMSRDIMTAIFTPAYKNGLPVRCWIQLPLRLNLTLD
jgi:hypothetical protein